MSVTRSNRPAFPSAAMADSERVLRRLAKELGRAFQVSLPVPSFTSDSPGARLKKVKQFSVGLLETRVNHDWSDALRPLRSSERMSVAGSLFLFRKCLPSPEPASPESHRLRVGAPEVPLPDGYLAHLYQLVRQHFPVGWDRGVYTRAVATSTPAVSATIECSRSRGGARACGRSREEFVGACTGGIPCVVPRDVRFASVACDGKNRAVTVTHYEHSYLRPLHRIIYDRLSRFDWLLRGEAKPCKFEGFTSLQGEVFVSGDYESATDHLPLSSAEHILNVILRNCVEVPLGVRDAALASLRASISYPDGCEVDATRQLMGSLLCFPLLCLQNYAAFRWCFPESVPVKINGDDIVFRSTEEGYRRWARFVGSVGLHLSPGKTMVDSRFFSLNSTFFRSGREGCRLVPVIRTAGLVRPTSTLGGLPGGLARFVSGWRGEAREALVTWWLEAKWSLIQASGRSVSRGLGIRGVTVDNLKKAGLYRRECWYFSVLDKELPLPPEPRHLLNQAPVEGWRRVPLSSSRRVRARQRELEGSFWELMVHSCWVDKVVSVTDALQSYWDDVKSTGFEGTWRSYLRPWRPRFASYRLPGANSVTHYVRVASNHAGAFVSRLSGRPASGPRCRARLGKEMRRWLYDPPRSSRMIWAPMGGVGRGCVRFVPQT